MLTTVIIVLLGLALFSYVALPLIHPRGADPLPQERDPVTWDLEEEKAALFRAIRELDSREDLAGERREQLRARYEAKAARVLRALDERATARPAPRPPTARRRSRIPYGALALLGAAVVIATTLSAYVLPRVGENATVTSFFREDLDTARALRDVQRVAERDPSAENLLALADAYWQLDDAEGALESYQRAVNEGGAQSALAYRRLGFLSLQSDLTAALDYLQRSRELAPTNLDTLYALGEIHFARADFDAASEVWTEFLAAPGGENDPQVTSRLELVSELEPLSERVEADPSRENLLAMADALWRFDERARAVEVYFQVLTQHDANDPTALGRTGQLMFLSGRNADAITLMERAALSEEVGAQTLLFLGNAYFSAERYTDAIEVWQRHVSLVGEESAGRVPALIEDARARQAAGEDSGADAGETSGASAPGAERANAAPDSAAPAVQQPGAAPGPALPGTQQSNATPGSAEPGPAEPGAEPAPGPASQALPDSVIGEGSERGDGASLFAANCAGCHGPQGGGGAGPRLAGNNRATSEQNVRNAVSFGRGAMPGFTAVLSAEEIDAIVEYVTERLSAGGSR